MCVFAFFVCLIYILCVQRIEGVLYCGCCRRWSYGCCQGVAYICVQEQSSVCGINEFFLLRDIKIGEQYSKLKFCRFSDQTGKLSYVIQVFIGNFLLMELDSLRAENAEFCQLLDSRSIFALIPLSAANQIPFAEIEKNFSYKESRGKHVSNVLLRSFEGSRKILMKFVGSVNFIISTSS